MGLKEILPEKDNISEEVANAIKERIEMINDMVAAVVTNNDKHGKTFEAWKLAVHNDKKSFMDKNRLAFQASNPRFIQYFVDHNLTLDEINYVCLYAIGLNGKEVGEYMNMPSHVNLSSAIRKKLGIDRRDTNIGIWVRNKLKEL